MSESSLQEARRRFNSVQERVMTDGESWGNFLSCAARNHKYPFRDQLLIYDQRPNATACADIVNKGTKSVRLLSENGRTVRHVFDITDTHPGFGHEFDEPPYVWQIEPEDVQDVSARLSETYNVSGDGGLAGQLQHIAGDIARNFVEEEGTGYNLSAANGEDLEGFLKNSLTYYLMTRCGIDPHDANLDLNGVSSLTPEQMMTLGEAMNEAESEVLDVVEVVVRENHRDRSVEERAERERTAGWSVEGQPHDERGTDTGRGQDILGVGDEGRGGFDDLSGGGLDRGGEGRPAGREPDEGERRDGLREGGGHLDSVSDDEPETAAPAVDEVRTNETEISGGMESEDSPTGTGQSDETGTDERVEPERPAAGQEREPDGVGTSHEQFGPSGGGDSDEKPDLQLSFDFDRQGEQNNTPSADDTLEPSTQSVEPETQDTPVNEEQKPPVREKPEPTQPRQNQYRGNTDAQSH